MTAPLYSIVNAETDELMRANAECQITLASIRQAIRRLSARVVITAGSGTVYRVWLHWNGKAHLLLATDSYPKANAVRMMAEAVALRPAALSRATGGAE